MSERWDVHVHCDDHRRECFDAGGWCLNCPCRPDYACHAHVNRNFDKTWIRRRPMVSAGDVVALALRLKQTGGR